MSCINFRARVCVGQCEQHESPVIAEFRSRPFQPAETHPSIQFKHLFKSRRRRLMPVRHMLKAVRDIEQSGLVEIIADDL